LPVEQNLLNGLLVIDKPGRILPPAQPPAAQRTGAERLWTSHDVVARVRRISGQRRIGHTGTLDPMASGVLVLCLGAATRLVEYYQGETKRYYAEVVLGAATDTYDAEGSIVAAAPVPPLTPERLAAALATLTGEVWQEPPAYSAIKQGGEALYAKARRGEAVSAEARRVTFHRIDLLELRPPDRLLLDVVCSAGAYVRSLAHDLGRALQTYGYLDVLRRLAVGEFELQDAHTLVEIEAAAARGELDRLLRAPGDGLPLPTLRLPADLLRRLGHGQYVLLEGTLCSPGQPLAQVRDEAGALAGIVRCLQPAGGDTQPDAAALWKAEKWLL
jgi:tRNA pseudouridine55 synthase